ncbi:AraC family transcriptional regulator [Allohahella marinimesophila]|uniref:AraC family transcriptional regulator n=1 Tax=Allohahella marinimesophila TaxID=1054972 RepID=A0ABP7NJF4_9GAMM
MSTARITSAQAPGLVSRPAALQYLLAAGAMGLDTARACQAADLAFDEVLDKSGGMLTGVQLALILQDLLLQSGDPLLGLKSGAFVQPGSYSALGYILMSCQTLGQAVHRISPYEKLVGDMGTTHLLTGMALQPLANRLPASETPLLGVEWRCSYTVPVLRQLMVDNVFASWTQYARWLANAATLMPQAVLLTRPKPDAGECLRYEEVFGKTLRFGAEIDCIVIRTSDLSRPLRQPDEGLLQTLERHAELQLKGLVSKSRGRSAIDSPQADGFVRLVEAAIADALALGSVDQTLIATQLGVTARTLQRRLSAEGARFSHCVERARITEACRLLEENSSESPMSVAEIAARLGYQEPRSLHRAFRRVKGMTPGAWREQNRHC